jgi:hypothetical protein
MERTDALSFVSDAFDKRIHVTGQRRCSLNITAPRRAFTHYFYNAGEERAGLFTGQWLF